MNFSFCFTAVAIVSSISVLFDYGLNTGGPAVIIWGWIIASAFTLCIGMSLAEIAATYPSAGSVYHCKTSGSSSCAQSEGSERDPVRGADRCSSLRSRGWSIGYRRVGSVRILHHRSVQAPPAVSAWPICAAAVPQATHRGPVICPAHRLVQLPGQCCGRC